MLAYQWKSGARYRASAQEAGEMCKRLADEGRLTAETLVEENRPENAPLHNEFVWDDAVAGVLYRNHQARNMINSLVIVSEKVEPVRGFFKVEQTERNYESVTTILSNKDSTQRLFDTALRELSAIQRKYSALQEFSKVWAAIAEIEATQRKE